MEDEKKSGAIVEPELEEAVFATLVNEHRAWRKNEDEYRTEEPIKIPVSRRMDRRGRRTIRKHFRKQRLTAFYDCAYPAMRRAVAVVLLLVVMGMSSSAYAPQPRENIYNFITFYSNYEFVVEFESSSISTSQIYDVTAGWLPEGMEEWYGYGEVRRVGLGSGFMEWGAEEDPDQRCITLDVYTDSMSKQYTYNTYSNGERGDVWLQDGTTVHWWSYEREIGGGNVYVNMIWYDREHDAIFEMSGYYVTYDEMLKVVEELIVR